MDIGNAKDWKPRSGVERIHVIDAHTEGEPLRVIVDGFPQPKGATVLERRTYAKEHLDRYRTALMFEPRGHADMYGCLIMPPVTDMADFSVLFLHNEGYSTMCGHGILAVTRVVLETGIVERQGEGGTDRRGRTEEIVRIDTPAGLVTARAWCLDDRVEEVRFQNVASWAHALDQTVDVPGIGNVAYDIAFGGAFYAYVDAQSLGLTLRPNHARVLIDVGMRIKRAVMESQPLVHPESPDLAFLYGTIFTSPPEDPKHHARNVCIFAEGEVDRSPTGTGVSGRAALMHARGTLDVGESVIIESILGTTFVVGIQYTKETGGRTAIIPEVGGRSFITGRSTLLLDPGDPLRDGFIIR